jgi:hypothetical protein
LLLALASLHNFPHIVGLLFSGGHRTVRLGGRLSSLPDHHTIKFGFQEAEPWAVALQEMVNIEIPKHYTASPSSYTGTPHLTINREATIDLDSSTAFEGA